MIESIRKRIDAIDFSYPDWIMVWMWWMGFLFALTWTIKGIPDAWWVMLCFAFIAVLRTVICYQESTRGVQEDA